MKNKSPHWNLPPGITRGLLDYVRADHIAYDYDEFFAYNQLFDFDEEVLLEHFREPGVLVDVGCGTGRLLIPFAEKGFHCVGVDLSEHMLSVVGEKAEAYDVPIDRVLADMTRLDCLKDDCADYCINMFSTLGMIRGRENRRRVLAHFRRILKPGGLFAIHVHNAWFNLFDAMGRSFLWRSLLSSLFSREVELGDKFFDYRGIPKMFLHTFTQRELTGDLKRAGFEIVEMVHLRTQRNYRLSCPWFLGRFRANGWIVIAK